MLLIFKAGEKKNLYIHMVPIMNIYVYIFFFKKKLKGNINVASRWWARIGEFCFLFGFKYFFQMFFNEQILCL